MDPKIIAIIVLAVLVAILVLVMVIAIQSTKIKKQKDGYRVGGPPNWGFNM